VRSPATIPAPVLHAVILNHALSAEAWEEFVIYDGPVIKDGKYRILDKPGLGVELNEDCVRGHLMPGETWQG